MHLDIPHRFPWSTVLSVTLHGAVITGLLYVSVNHVVELPAPAPAQVISVSMVAPSALEPPTPEVVEPTPPPPEPEPESIPEPPKEVPVVIEKPKPKLKPKPKPEKKVEPLKSLAKPVAPAQTAPVTQTTPAQAAAPTLSATNTPSASVSSDPRPVSRGAPKYPPRAYALRQEGRVSVKFDIDTDGRVRNVEILSAKPRNMFEREVKQAMRKWLYESGKPAQGLVVHISFQIDGGSTIE